MILPLVALLLQTPQTPAPSPRPDDKPVRVWLGSAGPLQRGTPVHVYVQTTTEGNLVVLHRRTDGRIEVLFPANPSDDPFIHPGTYEVRDASNSEAFVVAEPDGSGLILAALSPDTYRFDEFVRTAAWNPDALVPSWSGADGEGALSDIVQRMLGDGYFNYDLATYTVAPPAYAMQDTTPTPYPFYPSCEDCTFIGTQFVLDEPFFLGRGFRGRDHFSDPSAGGAAPRMSVLALSLGHAQPGAGGAGGAGVNVLPARPVRGSPGSAGASPGIMPRRRAPVGALAASRPRAPLVRAMPLVPGRRSVGPRPRTLAAHAAPASFGQVRLTLSPVAPEETHAAAPAPAGSRTEGLVTVPAGLGVGAGRAGRAGRADRADRGVVGVMPRGRLAAPGWGGIRAARPPEAGVAPMWARLPGARTEARAAPATEGLRTMALPAPAWGGRAAATPPAGRRR